MYARITQGVFELTGIKYTIDGIGPDTTDFSDTDSTSSNLENSDMEPTNDDIPFLIVPGLVAIPIMIVGRKKIRN